MKNEALIKRIKAFRNSKRRICPLPDSSAAFTLKSTSHLGKILQVISDIPGDLSLNSKTKTTKTDSEVFPVGIYPVRSAPGLSISDTITRGEVVIGVKTAEDIFDLRVKSDIKDDFISSSVNLRHFTDIGRYDGIPLGLGSVVVFEFPSALESKKELLLSIIKKYLPLGQYPVIEYYS